MDFKKIVLKTVLIIISLMLIPVVFAGVLSTDATETNLYYQGKEMCLVNQNQNVSFGYGNFIGNITMSTNYSSFNFGNRDFTTDGAGFILTRYFTGGGIENGHGFTDESTVVLGASNLGYASFDSRATVGGSGSIDHYNAYQARFYFDIGGNATNVRSYHSYPVLQSGVGTVTNLMHFNAEQRSDNGGTVINEYGLKIDDIINSTNQYSIYSDGEDDRAVFLGSVSIGVDSNSYPLTVEGTNSNNGILRVNGGNDNNILILNSTDDNSVIKFVDGTSSIFTGLFAGTHYKILDSGATTVLDFITNTKKMIVGGNSPVNTLDVEGELAVGDDYSGSDAAPTNGAIIQGQVGIGTEFPNSENKLHIEAGNDNWPLRIESTDPLVGIRFQDNATTCGLIKDNDGTCNIGTKLVEDNGIALCWYCS